MRPGGDFGNLGCKEHFATPLCGSRYLHSLWKETRKSSAWTIIPYTSSQTRKAYLRNGTAALHQDSSEASALKRGAYERQSRILKQNR